MSLADRGERFFLVPARPRELPCDRSAGSPRSLAHNDVSTAPRTGPTRDGFPSAVREKRPDFFAESPIHGRATVAKISSLHCAPPSCFHSWLILPSSIPSSTKQITCWITVLFNRSLPVGFDFHRTCSCSALPSANGFRAGVSKQNQKEVQRKRHSGII